MVIPSPAALRDRIEGGVARTIPKLGGPLLRALGGRPIRIDSQQLSPQVQVGLRLERFTGGSRLPRSPRSGSAPPRGTIFAGPRIEVERVSDIELSGLMGPIPARLYDLPSGERPAPLVVYYHGGGHVIGDLDTPTSRVPVPRPRNPGAGARDRLPARAGAPLPGRGRGPPSPRSSWLTRWPSVRADPERIAVAGDSAGGNLAAVVCRLAAASDGLMPAFQALIYPVADYSTKRRSYDLFGEGFFLTREEMDWYRDHYSPPGTSRTRARRRFWPRTCPDRRRHTS